jgi:flagellar biosynthesis GTPase FlhF
VRVFLMIMNILLGGFVFVLMLILSYSHTADFFARGGYTGTYAHLGAVGCEMLFFLSNMNIIICALTGRKVPIPIRIASVISALVIGYSNVSSGFPNGGEAIAIGVLIFVIGFVAELVVSAAIISGNRDEKDKQAEQPEQEVQGAQPEHEQGDDEDGAHAQAEQGEAEQRAPEQEQHAQPEHEQSKAEPEQNETAQPERKEKAERQRKRTVKMNYIDNGYGRVTPENYEKIKEAALQYKAEHGKLPGRPTLMKLTGCPQRQVDAVKKELEDKLRTAS